MNQWSALKGHCVVLLLKAEGGGLGGGQLLTARSIMGPVMSPQGAGFTPFC